MPVALSYPGVYIEEIPSGVRTITGVATSITAFIGRALRGPVNEPVRVQSYAEFERVFGGLWVDSTLGYAVAQFFLNGGSDALIVRVAVAGAKAKATISGLGLIAADPGTAGNTLTATIADPGVVDATKFKLTIADPPNPSVDFDNQNVRVDPDVTLPAGRPANAGPVTFAGGIDGATSASGALGGLTLVAANPGKWGQALRFRVTPVPAGAATSAVFNLAVRDPATNATEQFLNLSTNSSDSRFVTAVLEQQSTLVRTQGAVPNPLTTFSGTPPAGTDPLTAAASSTAFGTDDGGDGGAISNNDISAPSLETLKQGMWALEKADLFNLLCIPPPTHSGDLNQQTRDAAAVYCKKRRALFVVDPLRGWVTHTAAISGVDAAFMTRSDNAALFFPLLRSPDPLRESQIGTFAPCGAIAGVMARTDATRGVWKAPAGIDATLNGVAGLSVKLTDGENGQLNPLGVNCLRSFPVMGQVVWGSRTLRGADQLADQWKYIPVRRLALFIEESLFRGTQWVVFEPNDEPLWAQIRLNLGAFMHNLFRQGAFQGMTPREAYFVKCDKETTTQNDINLGIVNIVVGFAPLKPAEFVVIKIQQIAGQIAT
jgi:phage tail sheath protein FI